MTRSLALLLSLGLTLTGCGDKDDDGDSGVAAEDSGGTDGADGADGTADGADGVDGGAPSVESGRVVCVPATSGPEAIILELQGADPQGADTIVSGAWRALRDGAELFNNSDLACSPTANCSASIRSEDYGTSCAEGPSLVWEVELVDEDGGSTGWVAVDWED